MTSNTVGFYVKTEFTNDVISYVYNISHSRQVMARKKCYQKMTLHVSMRLRDLHQKKGLTGKELTCRYSEYSPAVYRHMTKSPWDTCVDRRKYNMGTSKKQETRELQRRKKKYQKVPLEVSLHLRFMHQDVKISGKELVKRYRRYSKASIYKHMVKPIGETVEDRRHTNPGRPSVLSERDRRLILQQVPKLRKEKEGSFTLEDLRTDAGVPKEVSDSTLSRVLHKEGFALRNKRRKGVLTEKDLKVRLKFAKHANKILSTDVWCADISFYIDGVGFTHKFNPSLNARDLEGKKWRVIIILHHCRVT